MAQTIGSLFNNFDDSLAAEISKNSPSLMEESFVWLRASLGECGDGEPMVVRNESRARYIYPCERGHLEAEFAVDADTGKIPGMLMGARGVPLEDAVRAAAEAVMRLFDAWDPELFHRTFNAEKFDMEDTKELLVETRSEFGACTLGEPDLVSARGALIHLNCEQAVRLMKVELGPLDDDRIRILWIDNPRPNR